MPWSPSSTERFLQCPMRWWLDRQGAIGRVRDESAMEQGSAYHAAMAMHWGRKDEPVSFHTNIWEWHSPDICRAVERAIAQEGEALREQGVVCVECVLGGTPEEIARHGRYPGTADLVTDNGNGLTVTDYKCKMNLQPAHVDAQLRETQRSWQLKQYAWFVQEKYKQPVTHVRKLLVAFKPTLRVWLVSYPVTQQELSMWYEQAAHVWHLMDEMTQSKIKVWRNADACERYGWQHRCDFYEHCWDGQPIECKESANG